MYTIYGLFEESTMFLKYVGITKQSTDIRKKAHIRCAFTKKREDYNCPNYCWIRSVIEKGGKIEIITLKIVDSLEEADAVEKMLISILGRKIQNSGALMNTTDGGISYINRNSPTGVNNKKSKKVMQFDAQGNMLKEYDSIKDAAFLTGLWDSHISQCCRGKRHHCGRFIWRYSGDKFNKYPVNANGLRRIVMYSKEGVFMKIFECALDAAKEVNLKSSANLVSACKGTQVTYGGYLWRYEGDPL